MNRDKRVANRHRCRLRVRIHARGRVYTGHVLNISRGGMRLTTDEIAEVWTGDDVEVVSSELGAMTGVARWRGPGELGIRFHNSAYNAGNFDMIWRRMQMSAKRMPA
ncbi:MAG: PilZ domain-containing protein [Rhizobiaceae bacterium]|nr:PilZ domain-containing protein [Rhizobiaceae bacterium]